MFPTKMTIPTTIAMIACLMAAGCELGENGVDSGTTVPTDETDTDTDTDTITDTETTHEPDLEVTHSGHVLDEGGLYYMLEIDNADSGAVAIFSELKDPLKVVNISGKSVTIDAITLTEAAGLKDEEWEPCDFDSASGECIPIALPPAMDGAGDFWYYLHFYPIASGERNATMTIEYTVDGTGRTWPSEVAGFGRIGADLTPAVLLEDAELERHTLWGGYDTNHDEFPGPTLLDPSGNLFFAGTASGMVGDVTNADREIFLNRVNADGTLAWQKIYHSSGDDRIPDTNGGNNYLGAPDDLDYEAGVLYVGGMAGNGFNKSLGLISAIDPADGSDTWTRYWHPDATRLQYTDAGKVFGIDVVGNLIYVALSGFGVACLNTDGTLNWSRQIVPQGDEGAHEVFTVKADASGNVWLAGIDKGAGVNSGFVTKLSGADAAGANVQVDWAKGIDIGWGSRFNSMDVDSNGDVYLSADRRGAQTYFSVIKVSADGNSVIGRTLDGSNGDRQNTQVVRVTSDAVWAGGRIGMPGWDTGSGDGLVAKLSKTDLSKEWAAVYYTGTGPNELCQHTAMGLATNGDDVHVMGQVYTGNSNFYRYWGYWYDFPETDQEYAPTVTDHSASTTVLDLPNAALVDGSYGPDFENDGSWQDLNPSQGIEYQDAVDKNADSHGSATDSDVFIMKLTETP